MTVNILRKAIARLAPNYKVLRKFRQTNMEVTKINFKEKLPEIEKAIDDSIFVAIDGEFTGLTDKSLSPFDTPEERCQIGRAMFDLTIIIRTCLFQVLEH